MPAHDNKEYHLNEVKAGLMVVLCLIIFAIVIIAVTGLNPAERMASYKVHLRDIQGLEPGSDVRFGGMRVGKIAKVEMSPADPTVIEIAFEIRKEIPLKEDSEAYISKLGLTGENYLEITTGSSGTPLLRPGAEVRAKATPKLEEMMAQLSAISGKAEDLLTDINKLFDEKNRAEVAGILSNVNNLVQSTSGTLEASVETFKSVSTSIDSLVKNVDGVVVENRVSIKDAVTSLKTSLDQARVLLAGLDETVRKVDGLLVTLDSAAGDAGSLVADNRPEIQELVENLRQSSKNLKQFTQTLQEQPWAAIRRSANPERKIPE